MHPAGIRRTCLHLFLSRKSPSSWTHLLHAAFTLSVDSQDEEPLSCAALLSHQAHNAALMIPKPEIMPKVWGESYRWDLSLVYSGGTPKSSAIVLESPCARRASVSSAGLCFVSGFLPDRRHSYWDINGTVLLLLLLRWGWRQLDAHIASEQHDVAKHVDSARQARKSTNIQLPLTFNIIKQRPEDLSIMRLKYKEHFLHCISTFLGGVYVVTLHFS